MLHYTLKKVTAMGLGSQLTVTVLGSQWKVHSLGSYSSLSPSHTCILGPCRPDLQSSSHFKMHHDRDFHRSCQCRTSVSASYMSIISNRQYLSQNHVSSNVSVLFNWRIIIKVIISVWKGRFDVWIVLCHNLYHLSDRVSLTRRHCFRENPNVRPSMKKKRIQTQCMV